MAAICRHDTENAYTDMYTGTRYVILEMSTRNSSLGVNAAGVVTWQLYHFQVPILFFF